MNILEMVPENERQNLQSLLTDTITLMCHNSLMQRNIQQINALIGVTLQGGEVILITINETTAATDHNTGQFDDTLQSENSKACTKKTSRWKPKTEVDCKEIEVPIETQKKQHRNVNTNVTTVKQEIYAHEIDSESDDCKLIETEDEQSLLKYDSESRTSHSYQESFDADECLQWQAVDGQGTTDFLEQSEVDEDCMPHANHWATGLSQFERSASGSAVARSFRRRVHRRNGAPTQRRVLSGRRNFNSTAPRKPARFEVIC